MKSRNAGERYPGEDFVNALHEEHTADVAGTFPGSSDYVIQEVPQMIDGVRAPRVVVKEPRPGDVYTNRQWRQEWELWPGPEPYDGMSAAEWDVVKSDIDQRRQERGRQVTPQIGEKIIDAVTGRAVLGSRARRNT